MKKFVFALVSLVIILIAGFFIPLGSYTTKYGCRLDTVQTSRLHFIKGDSLNEVKNRKDAVGAGCAIDTKYVLYFL